MLGRHRSTYRGVVLGFMMESVGLEKLATRSKVVAFVHWMISRMVVDTTTYATAYTIYQLDTNIDDLLRLLPSKIATKLSLSSSQPAAHVRKATNLTG